MIGDSLDIFSRLKVQIPKSWFDDELSPYIDSLLQGAAVNDAFIYSFITFAKAQTRIKTATGNYLDLIARDFFGSNLVRKTSENDDAFRVRILLALFQEKATRSGVSNAVKALTGSAPEIIEPFMPYDTGAYDVNGYGYDAAGYYSENLNNQVFMKVKINYTNTANSVYGYDSGGAYDMASNSAYLDQSKLFSGVTQQNVLDVINATKAQGIVVWVAFV